MNKKNTTWGHYLVLFIILSVALLLRIVNIQTVGYGNQYYASTVFSMLTSAKNFFFAAFDPAGFVSVDKPPLGFWMQALSTSIFGFKGWALMLPQILSGIFSCFLLFVLVRHFFGPNAGLAAALIMALTPIAVAADRNNTIDSQLVFVLLCSTLALIKAAEKGSLGWLLLGAVGIGLGFNIKMLQAYMILPAFYGFYFLCARTGWGKRFLHLAFATLVIIGLSSVWVLVVDSTPASERPYVGSSEDNSVYELIVGHNGVERLGRIASWFGIKSNDTNANRQMTGQNPQNGTRPQGQGENVYLLPGQTIGMENPPGMRPQGQPNPQNGAEPPGGQNPSQPQTDPSSMNKKGMADETGNVGILRLFNPSLVGQTSWLLPLALMMILLIPLSHKWRWPLPTEHQFALLWGLWLVPMVIFFSFAGLFHRYYLEMLSPAIAALAGAGIVHFSEAFFERRKVGWLLPLTLALNILFEVLIALTYWPTITNDSILLTLWFSGIALIGWILLRILDHNASWLYNLAACMALAGLLVLPFQWALTPISGANTSLPYAGPELLEKSNSNQTATQQGSALMGYLIENWHGEIFVVAADRASTVAPIILQTGKAAMAIGGFTGSDPILTLDQFKSVISSGELRFVLAGGSAKDSVKKDEIMQWVAGACINVDLTQWTNQNASRPTGQNQSQTLYDCQGAG